MIQKFTSASLYLSHSMKSGAFFHRRPFSNTQKSANKGLFYGWKEGYQILFAFHSPSIETPVNVWMYVCGYRQNRCNNRWGLARAGAWSCSVRTISQDLQRSTDWGAAVLPAASPWPSPDPEICAALASFIVDPWSRCDRGGPNWYVMSMEKEGWWMNRI